MLSEDCVPFVVIRGIRIRDFIVTAFQDDGQVKLCPLCDRHGFFIWQRAEGPICIGDLVEWIAPGVVRREASRAV